MGSYRSQWHDSDVPHTFAVQETPPANHKSWSEAFPLLIRDVAKGQRVGEYLILEGDLLPRLLASKQIFLSPFGGAPKDGKPLTECARIVHDESFPRSGGMSINAATTNSTMTGLHTLLNGVWRRRHDIWRTS
jgi:hypothetical protein